MKRTQSGTVAGYIVGALIFLGIVIPPARAVIPRISQYTAPYYTDAVYRELNDVFAVSQYRKKNNPAIIPDETLFSYAAGAYLRGMDPILVNSEHTPLGKYALGAFIYLFGNDRLAVLWFGLLAWVSIWLVSRTVLGTGLWAAVPLLFVSWDVLFINQLVVAPLLDIIQLPFVYLSILCFLRERKRGRFPLTALAIGFVIDTKTIVPGILLTGCMTVFFLLKRDVRGMVRLVSYLPLSVAVLMLSYAKTFMDGYSLRDFLGFQKWIFLYQKSKLMFPFSSLRLLLFNQWQTWWGSFAIVAANDWSYLWPVSTVVSFIGGIWAVTGKRWKDGKHDAVVLLLLWIAAYQAFLCFGVVSSRFFLPLLPAQYILMAYILRVGVVRIWNRKGMLVSVLMLAVFLVRPQPAQAAYVLPYPSYMPGNTLYAIAKAIDRVKAYWYRGDIAALRYHMGLSDKYLVEAKTLFEYKQYLLGISALQRSDAEFETVPRFLAAAGRNGKDIRVLKQTFVEASVAHTEILSRLMVELPASFTWTPEKRQPSILPLRELLEQSVSVRRVAVREAGSL